MTTAGPTSFFRCRKCGVRVTAVFRRADHEPKIESHRMTLPAGAYWMDTDRDGHRPGRIYIVNEIDEDLLAWVDAGGQDEMEADFRGPCGHQVATKQYYWDGNTSFCTLHADDVVRVDARSTDLSGCAGALVFGNEGPCKDAWAFHKWLHESLRIQDWYGDDVAGLLTAWAATNPPKLDIVWWGAEEARRAGLRVVDIETAFEAHEAMVRLFLV